MCQNRQADSGNKACYEQYCLTVSIIVINGTAQHRRKPAGEREIWVSMSHSVIRLFQVQSEGQIYFLARSACLPKGLYVLLVKFLSFFNDFLEIIYLRIQLTDFHNFLTKW